MSGKHDRTIVGLVIVIVLLNVVLLGRGLLSFAAQTRLTLLLIIVDELLVAVLLWRVQWTIPDALSIPTRALAVILIVCAGCLALVALLAWL